MLAVGVLDHGQIVAVGDQGVEVRVPGHACARRAGRHVEVVVVLPVLAGGADEAAGERVAGELVGPSAAGSRGAAR